MPQLIELPVERIRVRSYLRVTQVLTSVRRLRSGGTASDVRESYIDTTGERIAVSTVRCILFHLSDLGLVSFAENGNARWWSASHVPTPVEMPTPRSYGPGYD